MGTGAKVGHVVYLAGGLETPDAQAQLTTFYALDLNSLTAGWRLLPTWPGRGRSQAVAAAAGDYFYLFSGFYYEPKAGRGYDMKCLKDSFRFSLENGWERLPDLYWPAAAAASPAPVIGHEIFLIGGIDQAHVGVPPLGLSAESPTHSGLFVRDRFGVGERATSSL